MPSASTIEAPGSALGAPLDLHEGIDTREPSQCERWPQNLRLESTLGKLVPGRCKAVNLCDYCAKLAAVETSELLALDAVANSSPGVWSVLTTRTATMDIKRFRRGRHEVRRAVKRRWPEATAATMIEMTSGLGTNSGGERRPHWNDLWKGIVSDDLEELRDVTTTAWLEHVDGTKRAQHVGEIAMAGGLMRYLALHFQKESQQPPKGWRGHRFRAMKGYLAQPMSEAREEARQSLRFKREIKRALLLGLTGEAADEYAHTALYEANETAWELVRLQQIPTTFDLDDLPTSWATITTPIRR